MLRNYLKIAFKVLLRRKFFTFVSLFAISFTLVVLMVAAALVDSTFGPQAPETRLDRTIGVFGAQLRGPQSRISGLAGYRLLDTCARGLPGVEAESFFTSFGTVTCFRGDSSIKLSLRRTDGAYWRILDFTFLEGGPLTDDDERNRNMVAVINASTRQKLFDGEDAVGKTIAIDGQSFRVCGVVGDVSNIRIVPFADVWVPLSTAKSDTYKKEVVGDMMAMLLARDAADIPMIKAEYAARVRELEPEDRKNYDEIRSSASTFFEYMANQIFGDGVEGGSSTQLLAVMIILMALFMVLPAVNLINLNEGRIMERASEIGVRKAFGASSRTLAGQFIVENLVVTLAGGALAFVVSLGVLRFLSASGQIPHLIVQPNIRLFLYGLTLAVAFGLVSGVYPAWKMSRLDPVHALNGGF
jgi:putative ABC transport system permease protein